MNGIAVMGVAVGAFLVVGGLLLSVFSKQFANFQRETVSRFLPRRYWVFGSDPMAVRFFGVVAASVGLVIAMLAVVSLSGL